MARVRREYNTRSRDHDHDDDDDDDDYKSRGKPSMFERILTPGTATNNVIKTAATAVIVGGTIILMGIFAMAGDRLAGASYLPIITALSSAAATACVWIFGRPKTEAMHDAQVRELKKHIADLNHTVDAVQTHLGTVDKRLANAEYIEDFEERLARKEILSRKLASDIPISKAPISSPESEDSPSSHISDRVDH